MSAEADSGELIGRPAADVAGWRPPSGTRTAAQIQADIELQRYELSRSVDALRGRVRALTDWRRQVREHRRELVLGAAIAGFAVGGLIALRRRSG
jgi:hypothetical protein